MRERATTALREHAPELADQELVEVGHGLEHAAYLVGDLVLRVADDRSFTREARLLEVIAPRLSILIPTPRFADAGTGVLAYGWIPGQPLLGRAAPPGSAGRLGIFLRELHSIDVATVEDLVPIETSDPDAWLEELDGPAAFIELLHATRPEPSPQRVLAHADLGGEHILEVDGELTGVIDWSDAAITDPALDFARLYRDFGPAFLEETLHAYGQLPDAMPRIEFFARCAALEDLAYGRREYVVNAERSFAWLFP